MGKGRPRAVEKGVLGQNSQSLIGALNIPQGPTYYPTEDEFQDPLKFIFKIRPEAEPYGVCKIVPPNSWKPTFALDLDKFTFPTKTQAIHQLQARAAACDPDTFELEYNRFLEDHCGKKLRRRVIFEGEDLDLCKLFNAVKRYGGYDKVVKDKKWGEVFKFVRSVGKISECSKHVLCQLYREHLYDYESYNSRLNSDKSAKKCKRGMRGSGDKDSVPQEDTSSSKKKRKNLNGEKVKDDNIEKQEEFDQICEQCRSGLHGEVMLLCDRCNKGWHIYCLSPPLKQIPPGNWYCLECVNSDKDSFGFVPGRRFSLETFRRLADRAKRKWFGSASPSRLQIEKKFWEIVDGSAGEVEVMYGNDLDTSVYGSGFPRRDDSMPASVEVDEWNKYSSSPWNLNNLPKLQGSMLQAVHNNIAGVMVPWLYIGMLFSSFCWHFEDHCFYSINYLHWGEPKCWYSVPGSEAQAFEKVMRKTLPDLFDAQPDLLFQLVTMLNPSVLQENGVPVYTVLQEPGNFVITFPRSFHGGFNLGLNCAEAVNFAPADWLPHGGCGAELYRLYHKPAVLSHEELLCVAAKRSECNDEVSPFLKKELLRIFNKEKTWRERLWRCGLVKSSRMSPRKHPDYVGTEEDPTCVICQQYLYLSAVSCSCRPSSFVCLEHWGNLCECRPQKHRLHYRHTLAELNDLMLALDKQNFEEIPQSRTCRRQCLSSDDSNAVTKKVKSGRVTHAELAEEWLLNSLKIVQNPFSNTAYVNALKEAEQFLWAGAEMDPVRDMARNLVDAKKWALDVRSCLAKVENIMNHRNSEMEKVTLGAVQKLLSFNQFSCNEPGHLKLKIYADDASLLLSEIVTKLSVSSRVSMDDLETLYARATELPIYVEECGRLAREISSAKGWIDRAKQCVSAKPPTKIEIDDLYTLKLQMLDLHVQFPEMEFLLDLSEKAEAWQARCSEMLEGPIILKELEILLNDADSFLVNIPELKLLGQHHSDAVSWISCFHKVVESIQERDDQESIVQELTCILKDGQALRVKVDELPRVEIELKRASCRVKALKARCNQMALDYIQQLISEATVLNIEREKLFIDISGVLVAAIDWEDRARRILGAMAKISELEDVIRASEKIFMILPSLRDVKDIYSSAKSWLRRSQQFFGGKSSSSLLSMETLKEVIAQSKLLKVSLEEPELLQRILKECEAWEFDANVLLGCAESIFNMHNVDSFLNKGLAAEIAQLLDRFHRAISSGSSLGFNFPEICKLQHTSSKLQLCLKALSFCSKAPLLEEVEKLIEDAKSLSVGCAGKKLESSLMIGVRWLQRALEVFPKSCTLKRCKVTDVERILEEVKKIEVPFPEVVSQLENAIEKHKSWQEMVHVFFDSRSGEKSWSALLQLKDLGNSVAFSSLELDRITSESGKVEKWILCCKEVVELLVGEVKPLCSSLSTIKHNLDRSIHLYQDLKGCGVIGKVPYMCCASDIEDQDAIACMICKDWYHLRCLGPRIANSSAANDYTCPYCLFMESGAVTRNGRINMIFKGKRPELKILVELLSAAKEFCIRIEETERLQQVVEHALDCKAFLTDIVDCVLAYVDGDLSFIYKKLLTALKALSLAGISDQETVCSLELALTKYSWKIKANKLLLGSQKPLMQQIQRIMKDGSAINISAEDFFMKKLADVKSIGLQWCDKAKKVSSDSGELGLDEVFKLIEEGENLPVHFEKELKLLRARSVLYCICRKPYDNRAMIACDSCDEWYHFDCISLCGPPPKTYHCPACKPSAEALLSFPPRISHEERSTDFDDVGPHTPSPRSNTSKRQNKSKPKLHQKTLVVTDLSNILKHSNGIDQLWWRNRKPFKRTCKKRVELDSLSPFSHL
ncbi:Lysine-specific demethylase 5b [Thalictrum thalictroides]|uniref:Lysine-specific demethylase 5b n=1 Tax=Thalictrum thalictroides TaxID=46969 RepID=A0A7J6US21_THATH|nr:Lysine-specific demethylase 5b [Thalictrum thalictroides]